MMETLICYSGPGVECSVASRPMAGQDVSGDTFVCQPFEGGTTVCVIDGLGHGTEAAAASLRAREIIMQNPGGPLIDLVQCCDSVMRESRGAVASLARFDAVAGTLSWLGVGNVEGIMFLHRADGVVARERLLLRGGVVGYNLPPLHVSTFEISRGDTLILVTDGLESSFTEDIDHDSNLQDIARGLLERYGKMDDDALVLVARYVGE